MSQPRNKSKLCRKILNCHLIYFTKLYSFYMALYFGIFHINIAEVLFYYIAKIALIF